MDKKNAYWFLKSVSEEETNYKSNNGYNDEIETKYVYDSDVANHKNIKIGDIATIADKEKVLGIARISSIVTTTDKKERRRCPICENKNSTYDVRKRKKPTYRCNKGHVFETPTAETVDVTLFQAFYSDSFKYPSKEVTVDKIRPYFNRNYNQNMSMQSLSGDFFEKYFPKELAALKKTVIYPLSDDAIDVVADGNTDYYTPTGDDERIRVFKEIMQRRGQKKFRDSIRKAYGDKCMITGCEVLDVLEAAHINPYKGEKDNKVANGLLLRSDIHTLFDLDLIGIHPENLKVHLSESIKSNFYSKLKGITLNINKDIRPSKNALEIRWKLFKP